MDCPVCGHEMTQSARGWLCLGCGHVESAKTGRGKKLDSAANTEPAQEAGTPPKPEADTVPETTEDAGVTAPATAPAAEPAPAPEPVPEPATTPAPEPAAAPAPKPAAQPIPVSAPPVPAVMPSGFIDPRNPVATTMTSTAQRHHRLRRRWQLFWFWLIFATLIGLITAAGYLWVYEPHVAATGMLQRLLTSRSGSFAVSGDVTLDSATSFTVMGAGNFNVRDEAKPQADTTITLTSQGTPAGTMEGRARLVADAVYLQFAQSSFSPVLVPVGQPADWYRYALKNVPAAGCASFKLDQSSILSSSTFVDLPVAHVAFAGINQVKNAPMLHFTGEADMANAAKAVKQLNRYLNAACQLPEPGSNLAHLTITYDVWRGWSSDRLAITLTDSQSKLKVHVVLDTSNYGRATTVEAPEAPHELTALLDQWQAAARSPRRNPPAVTATAEQLARDQIRKADVAIIRKALEEYFVTNGYYPKALTALTQRSGATAAALAKLPADPTNKAPYQYAYEPSGVAGTKATGYQLRACLENASDIGAGAIDPIAPCTTANYQLNNLE